MTFNRKAVALACIAFGVAVSGGAWAQGTPPPVEAKKDRIPVQAGDLVHLHTGAGGGYGDPTERAPEDVRVDVLRGYVSRQQAKDVYRVVIHADGGIDAPATKALRAAPA